jgi:adenylate kinase
MRIIFLGPPGSGKGTQAQFLCDHFHIPLVSTGEMLRAEIRTESDIGRQVKTIIESGFLAPDPIVINLLKKRIQATDCQKGFLLDGFPRTIPQADALQKAHIDIDLLIELVLSDSDILKRMTGRRIHPASGRIYHLVHNPPQVPDRDDLTGESLIQREDDKTESVLRRLTIYHQQTEQLLDYYNHLNKDPALSITKIVKINADRGIDDIRHQIMTLFKNDKIKT